MPAFHLVDLKRYRPAVGAYRRLPAINMATTRGCPGKCTFCNSASIPLRKRSAESIVAEMRHLIQRYGIREIAFYDDTFTVFPSNIKKLSNLIREHDLDIGFSCFARVDCVTADMLDDLKRAGCHQVMFGVESGSMEILRTIRKPIATEKTRLAVEMAKKAGLTVRCTFISRRDQRDHRTDDPPCHRTRSGSRGVQHHHPFSRHGDVRMGAWQWLPDDRGLG
ncbi:MAG: radical SAM protein [Magnetococcales bacterium]|nr:radical SAM protein [Magnetococcales bacterium]